MFWILKGKKNNEIFAKFPANFATFLRKSLIILAKSFQKFQKCNFSSDDDLIDQKHRCTSTGNSSEAWCVNGEGGEVKDERPMVVTTDEWMAWNE